MNYLSSNEKIEYGPGHSEPLNGNGHEYQRLLYIFDVIKDAVKQGHFTSAHASGIADPHYLVERFFEEGISLIRERGDGFPDITFVSENYVTIIDVCRVDASKPIEKAGRLHGSSFEYHFAMHAREMDSWTEDELKERLLKSGVTFTCGQLARNICKAIEKKNGKAQNYCAAISGHLNSEDKCKNFEVWVVLEDMTPTSDKETVDTVMDNLSQCHLDITGVIYVHNIGIGRLPKTIGDIKFYRLDC